VDTSWGLDRVEITKVAIRGQTFDVMSSGDPSGVPVLFLHGFPQNMAMWARSLVELGEKGFYAVAPNMRGYSPGARPKQVESYDLAELVADVQALADAYGWAFYHLVGHDWGGFIGWYVAAADPRVRSYTSLSTPHPQAYLLATRNDPEQQQKGAYIHLLNRRCVPEVLFGSFDFALAKRFVFPKTRPVLRDRFLATLRQRGAFTAMLNYYRANYHLFGSERAEIQPISCPVLYIWGRRDPSFARGGAEGTTEQVADCRFVDLDTGHWLIESAYEQVMTELRAFLDVDERVPLEGSNQVI